MKTGAYVGRDALPPSAERHASPSTRASMVDWPKTGRRRSTLSAPDVSARPPSAPELRRLFDLHRLRTLETLRDGDR